MDVLPIAPSNSAAGIGNVVFDDAELDQIVAGVVGRMPPPKIVTVGTV